MDINPRKDLIRSYIKSIPRGDWFVLYQLSKNLYRPFFVDFLASLSVLYVIRTAIYKFKRFYSRHAERKDNPEIGVDDDTGDNLLSMVMRPTYTTQESEMPGKKD